MKRVVIALLGAALLLCTGCASSKPSQIDIQIALNDMGDITEEQRFLFSIFRKWDIVCLLLVGDKYHKGLILLPNLKTRGEFSSLVLRESVSSSTAITAQFKTSSTYV